MNTNIWRTFQICINVPLNTCNACYNIRVVNTAWKVSKYGVISGPYFPTFGLNTERYFVLGHISRSKTWNELFNPLTTDVSNHIKTSQLICNANLFSIWWETLVVHRLINMEWTNTSNTEKQVSVSKKILFDRRYDESLFIYSRLVGMTI